MDAFNMIYLIKLYVMATNKRCKLKMTSEGIILKP